MSGPGDADAPRGAEGRDGAEGLNDAAGRHPPRGPAPLALVITELEVGGAETCLTRLALGLDKHLFAPIVYSLASRPSSAKAHLVEALEEAGVPVRFLNANTVWNFASAWRRLTRALRDQRPRVLQTFLFHANVLGALAARSARAAGAPPCAHIAGVRVAEQRRWRLGCERVALRRAARVVCVSEGVRRHQRAAGMRDDQLLVIPNGVDVARFQRAKALPPRALGLPDGARCWASVGRLDPQKGFDWLLAAAPRLLTALPDHHLLIVGEGPERSKLQSQRDKLAQRDRIHFIGWISDVPGLLRSCEALLLTSRFEGMPNVVLEAMASGLPVVAADVEGVRELLGPNAASQIYAAQDVNAFVQRGIALGNDPARAQRWGEANFHRVCEHFSLESMVVSYSKLYTSFI